MVFPLVSSIFGAARTVITTASNTVAKVSINQIINRQVVQNFLTALESQSRFQELLHSLIPTVYTQICLRYLLPLIALLSSLCGLIIGLYHMGIIERYSRHIMKICDALLVKLQDAFVSLIKCGYGFIQYGREIEMKMDTTNVSHLPYSNLRNGASVMR